jgi:two-component system response regulator
MRPPRFPFPQTPTDAVSTASVGAPADRAPLPRGAGDGKWILLVEDNAYDEALALRAFRKNGLESYVVVARDGVEALNRLFGDGAGAEEDVGGDRGDAGPSPPPGETDRPTRGTGSDALPRLVLLDLQLPRIDGFEVLRRLRARTATRLVPVVILSSSLEREDLAMSYSLGANSYIRKPVDFAEFIVTTSHLGLYWLGLNETCLPGAGE